MACGVLSGVAEIGETGAVAGVTMVAVDRDPEVATVGAIDVEGESIETVWQDVERGEWDTVETDDVSDSVTVLAATACAMLVRLQFVTGRAPPAA